MFLLPKKRKEFLEWARTNTNIFSVKNPWRRFKSLLRAKKYYLLQLKDSVLLSQMRQTKHFNQSNNSNNKNEQNKQ